MMLTGAFGRIADGVKTEKTSDLIHKTVPSVHETAQTGNGITVQDLREKAFLKSGGGWILEGGRVAVVEMTKGRIELYGKTIERHEPYANPWMHVYIGGGWWMLSHEFFLLYRNKLGDRAAILRKWVIADARGDIGYLFPRGFLDRGNEPNSVVVKVMNSYEAGLFVERVYLSEATGR